MYTRSLSTKSGSFSVIAYTGSEYTDLLVNEIGAYSGRVYVAPGVNLFKISSSGSWSVELRTISPAAKWNGKSAISGKGDFVILLTSPGLFGATTITNKGKGNFAVIAYSVHGEYLDLLVNEIGSYRGEVLLPIEWEEDSIVLSVHAVGGTWAMSAVQ